MTNVMKGEKSVAEPNPFVAGQNAAKAGQKITVTPYKKGSREWVRWQCGWQYQATVMGKPAATYTSAEMRDDDGRRR